MAAPPRINLSDRPSGPRVKRWSCRSARLAAWCCALLIAGAGCGTAPFRGGVYRGDGFAFQAPPPPATWEQIDVTHAAVAYRDAANEATIAVNGRCGVDGEDVPLSSLTRHLFIQFTDREVVSEEVVPFDEREAMHTVLLAKLDGVPKKFDVWVMKKDGCVYDFFYIAPPARFEAGLPEFRRFLKGFSTVSPDGD
jgi:hypothetical protein